MAHVGKNLLGHYSEKGSNAIYHLIISVYFLRNNKSLHLQ